MFIFKITSPGTFPSYRNTREEAERCARLREVLGWTPVSIQVVEADDKTGLEIRPRERVS